MQVKTTTDKISELAMAYTRVECYKKGITKIKERGQLTVTVQAIYDKHFENMLSTLTE